MKAELIAHFFLTIPPYRTVSPGMLCKPTKVAAANCQALSPVSSHCGDGTSAMESPQVVRAALRCRSRKNYATDGNSVRWPVLDFCERQKGICIRIRQVRMWN